MSSQRLPGKVLRSLGGRPLLDHVLDRLGRCRSLDGVAVATSTSRSDDPLAEWLEERGTAFYRGPLDDVAARFASAARSLGVGIIVRVSGDSPVIDHRIVDTCVETFLQASPDLVTNVFPRTFPRGQSVEVFEPSLLEAALPLMDPSDREHVTRYFYEREDEYEIVNVASPQPAPDVRMVIDTAEDYEAFSRLFASDRSVHDADHFEIAQWLEKLAVEGKHL